MKDKELRKLIGSRIKQRRLELNLTQPYVAEKMGVTASTILRYENGSIDNTKKMVLEGLSEARKEADWACQSPRTLWDCRGEPLIFTLMGICLRL